MQNSVAAQSQPQLFRQLQESSGVPNSNFPQHHQMRMAAAIAAAKAVAKRIEPRAQQKPAIVNGNGLASAECCRQLNAITITIFDAIAAITIQQWRPSHCSSNFNDGCMTGILLIN